MIDNCRLVSSLSLLASLLVVCFDLDGEFVEEEGVCTMSAVDVI